MSEKKVTTIEEIKEKAKGKVVQLPGWGEDDFFNARLKRPSILNLVTTGKIPNELLGIAQQMFEGQMDPANVNFKESGELLELIVKESLVEPEYEEVKAYLTDEQKLCIFQYTQGGIRALKSFREGQNSYDEIMSDIEDMAKESQRDSKD